MAIELDDIEALLEKTNIFEPINTNSQSTTGQDTTGQDTTGQDTTGSVTDNQNNIIIRKALPGFGGCEFRFYRASITFTTRKVTNSNSNVLKPTNILDMYNIINDGNKIKVFLLCNLSDFNNFSDNWMKDFLLFAECFNKDILKGKIASSNGVSSITFSPTYEQDVKSLTSDIRIINTKKYRFIFVKKDPTVLAHFLLSADNRTYAKRITYSVQYIPVEQRGEINKKVDGFKHNLLINGAPGTGKSSYIKKITDDYFEKIIEAAKPKELTLEQLRNDYITRVTFYEDYSYENFVGCYKPVEDDDEKKIIFNKQNGSVSGKRVSYSFEPGPFINAYINAVKNSGDAYFLVIEEINRAKAASVFGDIFQLLDRDENGVSEYSITPESALANYLAENLGDDFDGTMRLPSNLYIWATMNSADQGVFPLDSAFKRRWSFLYKDITAPRSPAAVTKICLYHNGKPMEVLWDNFRAVINDWILANNYDEDRCIGPWYFKDAELAEINEFTLCNDAEKRSTMSNPFVDKLLMYLRQDVFRMNADQLFSDNYLSMTKIRRAFYGNDDKFTADGNKNNSNPVDIENIFVPKVSEKLNELEDWQTPIASAPTYDAAEITTNGNNNG